MGDGFGFSSSEVCVLCFGNECEKEKEGKRICKR